MWQMTKQKEAALDAALNAEATERRHLESKAKAAADEKAQQAEEERAAEVRAWEEVGLAWLKEGETLYGPNYDYQDELKRLGMRYGVDRSLPYENLNDSDVIVQAGGRAIFAHGLLAFVISLIAAALGLPNWICLLASGAYVFWRFRVRRHWLLGKRADARAHRAEITEAHKLSMAM